MRYYFLTLVLLWSMPLLAQETEETESVVRERPEEQSVPPRIYLLRGLSREHGHWSEEFLGELRDQFPGVAITFMDLPGAGEYNDRKAFMSVKKMANFLHETHRDSLAEYRGNNILLATSLGGIVALEWMDRYPDDFDGAIMAASGFKGICKGNERVMPKAKFASLSVLLTGNMPKREAKLLRINSNYHQGDSTLLNRWITIQEERPISRMSMVKQGIGGMFYKPKKKKVTVPLLLLGSEGDRLVHPDCMCDVQNWFKATLKMHPSAGHGIPIDAPAWIVNETADWWERQLELRAEGKPRKTVEQGDSDGSAN